jgi:hypothetical protein
MPIIAKDNGSGGVFEPIPTGTQHAVCAFVEDIGTHEGSYNGKPLVRHQIVICWELAEKMTQGDNTGKPFMVSKFYTLSLNEKSNLYKDLISWRGKAFTDEERDGFDVERLIGANCLLNIVTTKKTNGKEYSEVASLSPTMKTMEKITPINTKPPKWIQDIKMKSIEWKETHGDEPPHTNADFIPSEEENLPF